MRPQTVVLCGGSTAEKRLGVSLSVYGTVQFCTRTRLGRIGTGDPAFLVYEFDALPAMDSMGNVQEQPQTNPAAARQEQPCEGIVLLGSRLPQTRAGLPDGLTPVFDSGNARAVQLLIPQQREAVSCGGSAQDTLSLASLSDTQAVISLQRSLRTRSGEVMEPRDIIVQLNRPYELFELMSVCAVLLLSGCAPDGRISLIDPCGQLFP